MIRFLFVYLAGLLAVSYSTLAQQMPPGGYLPHPVQRLERVPEPPGGLIPYRKGPGGHHRWGYADTTGRVIIAPTFTREPDFFVRGFGQYSYEPEMEAEAKSEKAYEGWPSVWVFFNARGETLRADKDHAVVLLPDSSLGLVERRTNLLAPALVQFKRHHDGKVVFVTEPVGNVLGESEVLGEGRVMGYQKQNLPAKAWRLAPELYHVALLDGQGHRLTPYRYMRIHPFHHGYARCERAVGNTSCWGLLDRSGREVALPVYEYLSEVANNRMLVRRVVSGMPQSALLDTTGHLVRPLHPAWAYWLVPGQLLAEQPDGRGGPVTLFDGNGRPLLGGQRLTAAEPTQRGSVVVECAPGAAGLLDTQARWIVPCGQYRFVRRNYSWRGLALPPDMPYQEVQAGRYYGVLDKRDGHAIVPVRYDTLLAIAYPVAYVARRAGHTFVLDAQGHEVVEGTLAPGSTHTELENSPAPLLPVLRPTGEVALFDAGGHRLTAWWPHTRHHLPQLGSHGRSFVFDSKTEQWGLIDSVGRVLLPFTYQWVRFRDGLYSGGTATKEGLGYQLFDDNLRLLHSALNSQDQDRIVLDRRGRAVAAPPGEQWQHAPAINGGYHPYPFEFGVWYTGAGAYATRGGTKLWEE